MTPGMGPVGYGPSLLGSGERPASLTPRQREALALYAELGLYKAVADRMGIAHSTVRQELADAYARLDVDHAFAAFRRMGWLVVR